MFKRPHFIALAAVLLLMLIVFSLPGQTVSQLKLALGSIYLPLLGLAQSGEAAAIHTRNALVPRSVLQKQISQLTQKNEELIFQQVKAAQLLEENQRLRKALDWRTNQPWNLKAANVILRDPTTWWRTLHIDLGKRDGIQTNMPVLTTDGLIGRTGPVGDRNSQVILIGDPQCKVAAIVKKQARQFDANGMIESSSSTILDPSVVRLTMVDRNNTISPGDPVQTSGLGPVFPKGIPIGSVLATHTVRFGLMNEADIKLAANLRDIALVWVLLP